MTGINSAQRVASFLRPTNKYTVGESSIDHMIRFVLPIRLLPVTTVKREWSLNDSLFITL
jgi:hypothetical protein